MTALSKQFPIDLSTGTIEQVNQSAAKIDNELGAIYGHLNNIRTRYRGATTPTNPEAGQQWEDTVNAKVMKWNGSAWVEDIAKSVNLTNRNTVLQGQVSSAGALELILGSTSTLTASLVSSAVETIITIPAGHDATTGNSDYIVSFSATQTDFWTSLPANNTSYLFVDYASGTVTGTYSVIAPVYQAYAPTHSAGLNWYDTNKEQWYLSDGSNWVAKYRCYVGSVVTDGTKVTATTIEPYNVIRLNNLDTDGTLAANSDSKIATQKAVKTYVAANSGSGAIGTGNYIAEPFAVTAGTGLEVSVAPNRCVIDETVCESTTATTVALTANYAQLIYKKKDNTYDKLLAEFNVIDVSTILRWVGTEWDGAAVIPSSVGTNDLTKNGTVAQSVGRIGYAATGNGTNGYLKAANATNIPAYANAVSVHHAFKFISNGAAQCFFDCGTVEIACTAANNLRVGGVDTAYTLTTLTDYKVSVTGAGGTTTGNVYVNGALVYVGAVVTNTAAVSPNICSSNAPSEYSVSTWHGTMIDSVVRTPAQIATLAQKLLIPCQYGTTDIRDALTNKAESHVVAFIIASATVPTTIIDPNDPKGLTPDWAYGIRVGPMGALNRRKFLGWRYYSGIFNLTWANPFDTRKLRKDFVWAQDANGKNEVAVTLNSPGTYAHDGANITNPIVLVNPSATNPTLALGTWQTTGYIGVWAENLLV